MSCAVSAARAPGKLFCHDPSGAKVELDFDPARIGLIDHGNTVRLVSPRPPATLSR